MTQPSQSAHHPLPDALLGKLNNVPQLPPHFLPRPNVLAALTETLLAPLSTTEASIGSKVTGLHGMGGSGKSVLAAALAREQTVRRAFPDGVLWVTLGQTPALTARQAQLVEALDAEPRAFEDPQQGRAYLSESLNGRACLLILDDAWQVEHVQAFDALGPHCRMVITTRDAGLLTTLGTTAYRLDVLDDREALQLLAHWAGQTVEMLPSEARKVAQECGNLPLALVLSGAQVHEGTPWTDLSEALHDADLAFLDHPYGSVMKTLQVSVETLPAEQARHYLALAVFAPNTTIPEATMLMLWQHADHMNARQARKLLTTLGRKALLRLEGQAPQRYAALHSLQHDYLRLQAKIPTTPAGGNGQRPAQLHHILTAHFGAEELKTLCLYLAVDYDDLPAQGKTHKARELVAYLARRGRLDALLQIGADLRPDIDWEAGTGAPKNDDLTALHQRLLDAYADRCPVGWPSGPDDGYFFQHMTYHLVGANRHETLRDLLFDFDWLQAKLATTDASALIADYSALSDDPDARLAQGAIRLSAHVLAGDKTQLAAQLIGRLLPFSTPDLGRLRTQAQAWKDAPWLRPLTPCLTPPSGPLLRTLSGHTYDVTAVTVTSDGRYAISASADRRLKVWHLSNGKLLRTLEGHTDWVNAVALTPDGGRAVSASSDKTLKVWDLERGALLHTLEGHQLWVRAVAVTPDGQHAISGCEDGTLKIWDLERGVEIRTLTGHTEQVRGVAVTPDGMRAVSGAEDKTIKVWDLNSGTEIRTLTGHRGRVYAVAVTPEGRRLVSAASDKTLKVWDLERGITLHTLTGHKARVRAVAVTSDGRRAVSASQDHTLKVWDLERGTETHTLPGHTSRVMAVAVTPDGGRAISASSDQTLKVWDLSIPRGLSLPDTSPPGSVDDHTANVRLVVTTPDGQRAISASYDHTLKVWDLSSGRVQHTLHGHNGPVSAVAVIADGHYAVSAAQDHTLRMWDLQSGQCARVLTGHTSRVNAVALTPDGRQVVSGGDDHTLRVWDLESGTVQHTLSGHQDWITAVAVTPDGERAVSASADKTLRVWDLARGTAHCTLTGHRGHVTAVVVTPDGEGAVSASNDHTLRIWDLTDGTKTRTLTGHRGRVEALWLTPDGGHAISAAEDHTLRVWDLSSGAERHTLAPPRHASWTVALAPSGRRIFTADTDNVLQIWDLVHGVCLARLHGDVPLKALALAPDEKTAVAGEKSGRLHFLRLEGIKGGADR